MNKNQSIQHTIGTLKNDHLDQNSHKELRVFLSSTFKDMMQERDYLTKHIFPEISKNARQRGIRFTAIDLRWGVTEEEANQGDVIRICLEEIDRCRPFFIGFLGERYGWIPKKEEISNYQELLSYFPIVEKCLDDAKSLTEIEMLHGVLEVQVGMNGVFYLRDLQLTQSMAEQSLIEQGHLLDFFEMDQVQIDRLDQLKKKIATISLYPIKNYNHLEKLGEMVKDDLMHLLNTLFPNQKMEREIDRQRFMHRNYAENRSFKYLPNPKNLSFLDDFLKKSESNRQFSPLLITGNSGSGKSALLSYWITQLKTQENRLIIEHYVGANGNRTAYDLLSRLILEVREIVNLIEKERLGHHVKQHGHDEKTNDQLPENLIDLSNLLIQEISLIPQNRSLLIVIDAINQITSESLTWLPKTFPPHVTLVISSVLGKCVDELRTQNYQEFDMQSLSKDERIQLTKNHLSFYRKSLSKKQLNQIVENEKCANPLFLVTVLAELKIFGSFEKLDLLIFDLMTCSNLATLFEWIIQRLENDYGKDLTRQVLTMIWSARYGLSEDELLTFTQTPRLKLSPLLLALEEHLIMNDGILGFSHDDLRNAVENRYLKSNDQKIETRLELVNAWMSLHEIQMVDLRNRKHLELPWLLEKCGKLEDLAILLGDLAFFEDMYENDAYELLHYWIAVDGIRDLEDTHLQMMNGLGIDFEGDLDLEMNEDQINLVENICDFLQISGAYTSPIKYLSWILKIQEKQKGVDHLDTLISISKLGSLLHDHGDYEGAEILYRRVLEVRERILGKDHLDTLNSVNNLGLLLYELGDYEGAEILYRRALEKKEKVLGKDHPSTLISVSNLGLLLKSKGDYEGAEILYRRDLEASERVLGKDHPNTLISINNLGMLLKAKGDYKSAETLYRRALEASERVLGKDHPDTLISIGNLGLLLYELGDYEGAEILYRRDLEASERVLGKDHPDTLTSMGNLAFLLRTKGAYDQSEIINRIALERSQRVLGKDHPDSLILLNNLGVTLYTQGKHQEAHNLLTQALKTKEKVLPKNHISTLKSCNYLALLLLDMQSLQEAIPLLRRVFKSRNLEIIQSLLEKKPQTLKYALSIQKNDPSIVQIAINQDPSTLQYASKRLQKQLKPKDHVE